MMRLLLSARRRAGLTVLSALTGATALGSTIYVDNDAPGDPGPGDPTVSDPAEDGSPEHPFDAIQEGIDAANAGDEVVLLEGTYRGPGNRDLDFAGKAIGVRSTDPSDPAVTAATVINVNGSYYNRHRGFNFHSGETPGARLMGLTITNGYHNYGAGIRCDGSSPTLSNCRLVGNSAPRAGGGLYVRNGSPTVTDCVFRDNDSALHYVQGGGGGLYGENSSPTLINCTFRENSSLSHGGAIYNVNSNVTMTHCVLRDNIAHFYGEGWGYGGGMYNGSSTLTVTESKRPCAIRGHVVVGSMRHSDGSECGDHGFGDV